MLDLTLSRPISNQVLQRLPNALFGRGPSFFFGGLDVPIKLILVDLIVLHCMPYDAFVHMLILAE
jgi:hypothetical protein